MTPPIPSVASEQLQSDTIAFLRFPLIVAVVCIHTTFPQVDPADYPVFSGISYFCSQIAARIAVPLFFLISGYLFFRNVETFTPRCYAQKLGKRCRTLLVPYLLWNAAYLCYRLGMAQFRPDPWIEQSGPILDYILLPFWKMDGTSMPIDYPLWFIRKLMLLCLFAPIIHAAVKRLHLFVLVPLTVLWLCGCYSERLGFTMTALLFFSFGAHFAIRRFRFVDLMRRGLKIAVPLYAAIAATELFFRPSINVPLHNAGIIVGIVAVVGLAAHGIERHGWRIPKVLSDSTFFIFAYHALPLGVLITIVFKLLHPHSETALVAIYFTAPALIIAVGVLLYALLKKHLPAFAALITGGR